MDHPKNIWAVGRNYADHAKELGNTVPSAKQDPLIFLKAGSTIVRDGETFHLPTFSDDIHHECEIAFRFSKYFTFEEITVALDLTARDVQTKLKNAGHPWTLAKSFKASCPIGPFVKMPSNTDLMALDFYLDVNGERRQTGSTADMIHSVEDLRRYVTKHFPVEPGDLLLTGTPSGVARLKSGDWMTAEIRGLVKAHWQIA